MRSPREISWRMRQELTNVALFLRTPKPPLSSTLRPVSPFPKAEKACEHVKGTRFADRVIELAEQVCAHVFPIFGSTVETGPDIDWHRDYRNSKTSGNGFFRRIPYLDFDVVGDHKWIWELNRHQHLIVLAQAYLLTGRDLLVREIEDELATWHAQNPFLRGINWASALEVAFRALSWIWVDVLAGDKLREDARLSLQNGLWLHARHLESNLSIYFSPNTHLLGEAVALYAIGSIYPEMPDAGRFAATGARIAEQQLDFQIRPDGSHFEQSTYYHVYALDFFLYFYVLAGQPEKMRETLLRMAEFLSSIAGPARRLFASGDDDGGRLFFPYGERDCFARATLATCATLFPESRRDFETSDLHQQAVWWIDTQLPESGGSTAVSAAFPDSGMLSITRQHIHLLFDAGPFGWGGAGHSHADTLNVLVRSGDEVVLADSGTYTYVSDLKARDWFRGTAAHNTIRIDGLDQANPVKPFRWEHKPAVKLSRWNGAYADACCEYRGFTHRRRVLLCGTVAIAILDDVTGPAGEHLIEQFWNLSTENHALLFPSRHEVEEGWRSDVYGSRVPARRMVVRHRDTLPITLAAVLLFDQPGGDCTVATLSDGATVIRAGTVRIVFPNARDAEWSVI